MKKLSIFILVMIMMLPMAGCACQRTPDPTDPTQSGVITPDVQENSTAAKLWAEFQQEVGKNPNATAQELATALVKTVEDQFSGEVTPLEKDAEYFAGFDNYRITGYRDGAMFAPMIGSIAFVGYVFTLENGTDVASFVKGLEENCNLRWNICVEAGQKAVGAIGNRVFFVMCP